MPKRRTAATFAFSLLLIASAGGGFAQTGGASLASVNGVPVMTSVFEAYLKHVVRVLPPGPTTLEAKKGYLRKFASDWSLAGKAEKAGLGPMAEAQILKQRQEVLSDYYQRTVLPREVTVDDREVTAAVPPVEDSRTVDAIVVEDSATAGRVLEEVAKGGEFSDLAKRFSIGISGAKGGGIGVVRGDDSRFTREQTRAIFSLREGEVSQPLAHENGYIIFRLAKLIPREKIYAEALANTREQLRATKLAAVRKQRAAELRRKATIWIDEAFFETGRVDPLRGYVAKVNGVEISPPSSAAEGSAHGQGIHSGKVNRGLLDDAIDDVLFAQEAEAKGFAKEPEAAARLTALRVRALAAVYLERAVPAGSLRVSEQEIQAYYKESYEPLLYRTRIILLPTREEALRVRRELAGGGDFEAAAKRSSIDASARKGGDTGFYPAGKMRPEFGSAVRVMRPGDISDVIRTDNGWGILKLVDTQKADVPALEAVRDRIVSTLTLRKRSEELQKYIDGELKTLQLKVDDKKLAAWTFK